MTRVKWSVAEYMELLTFVQHNFNKMEWRDVMKTMSLRFGRTENSIKTALISFNQVNKGLESSSKKGDKIGHCYGENLKFAFNIVSQDSNFSKSKWTYILS
tara:strand:- start:59 stop:361 length:303 start_codon:yes stop_codon:yes gene_type:complete